MLSQPNDDRKLVRPLDHAHDGVNRLGSKLLEGPVNAIHPIQPNREIQLVEEFVQAVEEFFLLVGKREDAKGIQGSPQAELRVTLQLWRSSEKSLSPGTFALANPNTRAA
jgi:hypothetical protein